MTLSDLTSALSAGAPYAGTLTALADLGIDITKAVDRSLLDLPLSRASFAWTWSGRRLTVSDLDLAAPGNRFGVRGDLVVEPDRSLSGTLWIGTRPEYVRKMAGLGDDVFFPGQDGLRWARVTLSGTSKKPRQDLAAQIMAQIGRHPGAILALGAKGISWYVGNWFGAEKDWQRPPRGDVTVTEGGG